MQRLSNAGASVLDGASVAAATKVTRRFSTAGSRMSRSSREYRWISSMNSTVSSPRRFNRSAADSELRSSSTRALTADSSMKRRCGSSAIRCAIVVLPVPGGPYSRAAPGTTTDCEVVGEAIRHNGAPGARTWSWPMTSSSRLGRIRSANGRSITLSLAGVPGTAAVTRPAVGIPAIGTFIPVVSIPAGLTPAGFMPENCKPRFTVSS